ncbi:hypothetical protein X874_3800 [Mannheimia varigena USDA-ARS-USMARC-1312]|nr:hypothetical protein X874_3800 [Mannheimia varigena USDA-ARS-USMARC-1312]
MQAVKFEKIFAICIENLNFFSDAFLSLFYSAFNSWRHYEKTSLFITTLPCSFSEIT